MKIMLSLAAAALLLFSCGKSKVCTFNETELPCEYYDLYTAHAGIEAQINASFDDDSNLTFEQEYELRENWVGMYNASTDSLTEAYRLVGMEDRLTGMAKMRLEEFEYFKEKKADREELKKFIAKLDIKQTVSDTSANGFEKPSLIMEVTNNSDKIIKSFLFEVVYKEGDKVAKKSPNFFILFSEDQLTPRPEEGEESYLKPGSMVVFDFSRTSATGEVFPEIQSINFLEEE